MNRPAIKREKLVALAAKHFDGPLPPLFAVGVPGYFRDSMGVRGKNDRGINDDGFIVVSDRLYATFNGNTDPSVYRDEVAVLKCPQTVWYKPGIHRAGSPGAHPAFRQDSPVQVWRDNLVKPAGFVHKTRGISLGAGLWTDEGYDEKFWTNFHRGGWKTTSSLGCLTVPPDQWDALYALIMSELKRLDLKRFPMILIPGPIN